MKRMTEELIDLFGSFFRIRILQEFTHLGRRRQAANYVYGSASKKLGICGKIRGHDVKAFEPGIYLPIDEILFGDIRIVKARSSCCWHKNTGRADITSVSHDQSGISGSKGFDYPGA